MEYVQRIVLEYLKAQPLGLGMLLTRQITWQLVKALEYMHNQKVRALRTMVHACRPPSQFPGAQHPQLHVPPMHTI